MASPQANLEGLVLEALDRQDVITDSETFCQTSEPALRHKDVVGIFRSLEAAHMVCLEARPRPGLQCAHLIEQRKLSGVCLLGCSCSKL